MSDEVRTGSVNGYKVIYIGAKTYYSAESVLAAQAASQQKDERIRELENELHYAEKEGKDSYLNVLLGKKELQIAQATISQLQAEAVELRIAVIEQLATKLESIADRAEQKGEFTTYETNRVEANRLYASWLRTMAHGAPVASDEIGAGIAAYEQELRDAVIDECIAAFKDEAATWANGLESIFGQDLIARLCELKTGKVVS